jgi:predicted O-methyltransferase YrrM
MTVETLFQADLGAELPIRVDVGRSFLAEIIKVLGYTRGAEIGVWEGAYSVKLCAPNPGLELICVDPWQTVVDYKENKNDARRMALAYDRARAALAPYNCRFMQMTSVEAAPQIPDGSLDFVYIDGNHLFAHVLNDIQLWAPKVRAGGIVAGHDYTSKKGQKSYIQVDLAVNEYTHAHAIDPWFVLTGDKTASWLWVKR